MRLYLARTVLGLPAMRLIVLLGVALLVGLAAAPVRAQALLPPVLDDVCRDCTAQPPARALPPFIDGGWWLDVDPVSGPSYVRVRRHARPGVWVPGLVVWLGSWAGTIAGGAVVDQNGLAAIPFFGAFGSGIFFGLDGDPGRAVGYTLGGLAQLGGFVTFLVGLAGEKRLERLPVQLVPLSFSAGGGAGMSLRF